MPKNQTIPFTYPPRIQGTNGLIVDTDDKNGWDQVWVLKTPGDLSSVSDPNKFDKYDLVVPEGSTSGIFKYKFSESEGTTSSIDVTVVIPPQENTPEETTPAATDTPDQTSNLANQSTAPPTTTITTEPEPETTSLAPTDTNSGTTVNSPFDTSPTPAPFDSENLYAQNSRRLLSGICQVSDQNNAIGSEFGCDSLFATAQLAKGLDPSGNPITTPKNDPTVGLYAAVGVLAALLALILGLSVFCLLKQRKRGSHGVERGIPIEQDQTYPLKAHDMSNGTPDQVSSLQSQLAAERRRVNDLQAALLAQSSTPAGWSSAPAKDDRDVKRSFLQVFGEIKDLAGNYYRSKQSIGVHDLNPEAKDLLNECVDGWDSMLVDARGRMLLVRVIAGEVLRRSWDEGEFLGKRVGKGFRIMEKEAVKGLTVQQAHLWRVQTIGPLIATIDAKTRAESVSAIAGRINGLLGPFFPQGSHQNPTQYTESIVTRMSTLYLDLATQNAFYSLQPYISVTRPDAAEDSAVFEVASCEDVEQKFETGRDDAGREWSQAEGKVIRGFVFPAVVKYGDGRGGGWDASVIVVVKAQVFV